MLRRRKSPGCDVAASFKFLFLQVKVILDLSLKEPNIQLNSFLFTTMRRNTPQYVYQFDESVLIHFYNLSGYFGLAALTAHRVPSKRSSAPVPRLFPSSTLDR